MMTNSGNRLVNNTTYYIHILRQCCCMRQALACGSNLLEREDDYGILFVIYMIIYVII